jgi:hypothetical protein
MRRSRDTRETRRERGDETYDCRAGMFFFPE